MVSVITTLTATASDQSLTNIATVKTELGISGSTDDTILTRYVKAESSRISGFCNRRFIAEAVSSIYVYEDAQNALVLERTPVGTITSVTLNGAALTSSEYEKDADSGLLYLLSGSSRLSWGAGRAVVAYTGGYANIAALPSALEEACIQLVKARYYARTRDPAVRSEAIDGVMQQSFNVGANTDIPEDIKEMLYPFRRVVAL